MLNIAIIFLPRHFLTLMFILYRQFFFVLKLRLTSYVLLEETKYDCEFSICVFMNFHEFSYSRLLGFYAI